MAAADLKSAVIMARAAATALDQIVDALRQDLLVMDNGDALLREFLQLIEDLRDI